MKHPPLARQQLLVVLHSIVAVLAADEALGVMHSVRRIHSSLILGGIANETVSVREGDVRCLAQL